MNIFIHQKWQIQKRNKITLRNYRRDGNKCCGTLTGLAKNSPAGVPWICSSRNMWFSDFAKFLKACKCALSEGLTKARKLSASGGLRPLTPHQGLCPWTPLDPRIQARAPRARHVSGLQPLPPQLKIPGAATDKAPQTVRLHCPFYWLGSVMDN